MSILRYGFTKLIVTIVAAAVIAYAVNFISGKINFLERFSVAVTDIDFTDLFYEYQTHPPLDSNIVIVNIGYLGRSELAEMVKIISENKPRVIGLDVFFSAKYDSSDIPGTLSLGRVFDSLDNVVLISAYKGKDENGRDIVEGQSPLIQKHAIESLVNLNIATDDPEMGTVRSFNPVTDINGTKRLSFGFMIASFWDEKISPDGEEDDVFIRWYGYGTRREVPNNRWVFRTIDWHEIQNRQFDQKDLQDKIVLLGFAGKSITEEYSPADKFYSPLNRKLIGRSLPDMYGVEVHANIIKMIIDDDFIYHSDLVDFMVNYFTIGMMTLLLFWINKKYERQYSIASKLVLILFIDLFAFTAIELFFQTNGTVKVLIGNGLFIMLFLPDVYEFLANNLFNKYPRVKTPVGEKLEPVAEHTSS